VTKAALRRKEKELELVITDPGLGELVTDESFTVELLEFVHPPEIRSNLPNGGWRKISVRILIAMLRSGTVRISSETESSIDEASALHVPHIG